MTRADVADDVDAAERQLAQGDVAGLGAVDAGEEVDRQRRRLVRAAEAQLGDDGVAVALGEALRRRPAARGPRGTKKKS